MLDPPLKSEVRGMSRRRGPNRRNDVAVQKKAENEIFYHSIVKISDSFSAAFTFRMISALVWCRVVLVNMLGESKFFTALQDA